ncbi:MAG: methylated-DNA--[protein]-cysteine S-methyltransferase [Alcanivorax sp.]|uniref:methylated-DNA--[protein]-cysteine S-methyltransferase n=1 Tax=Alloalcanivorax marinus TaxID=1177169 RepID=UPI00195D892A|nr:methylated-DNA--[protein]-cysteine S-methyltransferase [Alloalcanivorax marinus]MBM7335022.1 methylated-DNA--[protein]-cysteine S-methyltransferase [Alloalcanivorax marinus]
MTALLYSETDSPLGPLLLLGDGEALSGLYMNAQKHRPALERDRRRDDAPFRAAREQLAAYFAGELRVFDLPLAPSGSAFQQSVWRALLDIPYGDTASYGELAQRLGKPGAARAVGLANGRNPLGIIVPCHRVIGASGTLTGYGGGLERKQWLLDHERRLAGGQGALPGFG